MPGRLGPVALLLVLAAGAACRGGAGDTVPTEAPSSDTTAALLTARPEWMPEPIVIDRHVQAGSAFWWVASGASIETLAASTDSAVVVVVLASEDLSHAPSLPGMGPGEGRIVYDSEGNPIDQFDPSVDPDLPPDHPKVLHPPPSRWDPERMTGPPTLSRYRVRIVETLAGRVLEDEEVWIYQSGGVKDGIAYEMEGNPVLEIGKTYFMFMEEHVRVDDWYWSIPWGRFELEDGRLVPVAAEYWRLLGVRKELEGATLDDIRAKVAGLTFRQR